MAGTYYWETVSIDGPWVTGSPVVQLEGSVDVPGGNTIKRILFNRSRIQGFQTGQNHTAVGMWSLEREVRLLGGEYDERIIYQDAVKIPGQVVESDGEVLFPFRYTNYLNAGDKELGFDQAVNYGKEGPGATAFQVHIQAFTVMDVPLLSNVIQQGHMTLGMRVLIFQP